MAKIHPFKAIRPTRDKAQLVSTRPLAAYRKHILRAKLDENPYTFLHVIHPEGEHDAALKLHSDERYQAVRHCFDKFIDNNVLFHEKQASFYLYRQTKEDHQFVGLIAGVSIDEYEDNHIKKHEATITSREQIFTSYLAGTRFNAEPVLLAHECSSEISHYLQKLMKDRPEYEFSTTDKIKHEMWVLHASEHKELYRLYADIEHLYIADGHHRSASSALLRKKDKKQGILNYPNQDYFMAFLIDEKKLKILEFQRLVKSLNGMSREAFLLKCSEHFHIEPLQNLEKPKAHNNITCVFSDHTYYTFHFKHKIPKTESPVSSLDAEILTQYILSPILNIHDLKTNKEIEFVPGNVELDKVIEMMEQKEFEVGFLLYPTSFKEIKEVADADEIMPPKSTWVEPKLRSGLTIYNINE